MAIFRGIPPHTLSEHTDVVDGALPWEDSLLTAFGAVGDGASDASDALIEAQAALEIVVIPEGDFLISGVDIADFSKITGPGNLQIGTTLLPAGNINTPTSLPMPSVFSGPAEALDYLKYRRIHAAATVDIAAGTHALTNSDIITHTHPDGINIRFVGAGSGSTILQYNFSGQEGTGTAAIKMVGKYSLGVVDRITIDGDSWSGHSDGGPTLGPGDPDDPIAVLAREGGYINLGTDVVINRIARNGVITFLNGTIVANSLTVIESGSDGIVASSAGSVLALNSTVTDIWGVGVFADYQGIVWAEGTTVSGSKFRGTSGGDGFVAANGGQIFCNDAVAVSNVDTGFTAFGGGIITATNATAGGSVPLANGSDGFRSQAGGQFIGDGATSTFNGGNGLLLQNGGLFVSNNATFTDNTLNGILAQRAGSFTGSGADTSDNSAIGVVLQSASSYTGDNLVSSGNGSHGCNVLDGSKLFSTNIITSSNTGSGIRIEKGAYATVIGCTSDLNTASGIDCNNANIRATSAVSLSDNGSWGVIARRSGIVDMSGVSEASVVVGNGSGTTSPTNDTSSGLADSFIYMSN